MPPIADAGRLNAAFMTGLFRGIVLYLARSMSIAYCSVLPD